MYHACTMKPHKIKESMVERYQILMTTGCTYTIEVVTLELVFPANSVEGEMFRGALLVVVTIRGVVVGSGQITPAPFSLLQL